jgi:DNA-binding SARP family transcriptional activator/tetratricopeptide (TPR) repeat protein
VAELRLLGAVQIWAAGRSLDLGPPKQRAVLAALAAEPNRPVPLPTLLERVWDQVPPPHARDVVYTHLTAVRRVLREVTATDGDAVALVRSGGGYLLEIDPERVDAHRFRRLAEQARSPGTSPAEQVVLLRRALDLWRGPALADVTSPWAERVRQAWQQQRLAAVRDWAEAELRLGRPSAAVEDLVAVTAEHPLVEPLLALLMRALHADGRDAEALDLYATARRRLAEELGVDPGAELQDVHQAILCGTLLPPDGTGADAAAGDDEQGQPRARSRRMPAQLPADVRGFTGRTQELAALDRLLTTGSEDRTGGQLTAVVVSAVSGTAGVGKTALAVRWAHRARARFPDGQLYLNLRGYDPAPPTTVGDALVRLLTGLGVPEPDIPADLEDRAARYRTEIAGRRILVVLDNASSVDQVRPLLPGSDSATVLVTSRDSLPGLIALDGARRLDLGLLPVLDAVALLRTLIGTRVDAEPAAAVALAERCARLPLALRVAAELAVARPATALADLVADLGSLQRRLELLDVGGDPRAAVRAVFSWSCRHLPPDAARTFRLLGLHPGADIDHYGLAALADTSTDDARATLELLARAHLVQLTSGGRYGMHDLLRAYASDLASRSDSDEQRRAALRRLFDYYLAATAAAMDALYPAEAGRRPEGPEVSTPTPGLSEPDAARAWLDAERPTLVAVARHAAEHGWPTHVSRLAGTLVRYLDSGHTFDALAVHEYARRAAREAGDRDGEAQALHGLGTTYGRLGRYEPARDHFERALTLFREAGDLVGQARAFGNLGMLHDRQGRYDPAADHHRQALTLFQLAGDPVGEANALTSLAGAEWQLGRYEPAADHIERALAMFREIGDPDGEAYALDSLGLLEQRLGRHHQAAEHHREVLTLWRRLGNRQGEAAVLDNLGVVHTRLGQHEEAVEYHRRAVALFRELGERFSEAWALNGLGEATCAAGRAVEAVAHHTAACAVADEIGSAGQQARAHAGLGRAHHALHEPASAREHYEHALSLYTQLSMPEADEVRAHLDGLAGVPAAGTTPR